MVYLIEINDDGKGQMDATVSICRNKAELIGRKVKSYSYGQREAMAIDDIMHDIVRYQSQKQ